MKSDKDFLEDLSRSQQAVNRFAACQSDLGVKIWLPPQQVRKNVSDRRKFADSGDMVVQMRVEHKLRSDTFTCRVDYPYEYVYVDEVYKIREKIHDPFLCYVIESADRKHCAVVYGWTYPHWTTVRHKDIKQNRVCKWCAVDKTYVRFCKIEEVFTAGGEDYVSKWNDDPRNPSVSKTSSGSKAVTEEPEGRA